MEMLLRMTGTHPKAVWNDRMYSLAVERTFVSYTTLKRRSSTLSRVEMRAGNSMTTTTCFDMRGLYDFSKRPVVSEGRFDPTVSLFLVTTLLFLMPAALTWGWHVYSVSGMKTPARVGWSMPREYHLRKSGLLPFSFLTFEKADF